MDSPLIAEAPELGQASLSILLSRLLDNIGSVVLGKSEVIKLAVVALLAEGHVLVEDVPGVGKTLLARAMAASIDCSFRRLQFTPDLLPSDILGSSVYNAASGEFTFKPGPIFANVILADEINRTTPRTQSALLEAMSDGQVSVEGRTHILEPPFLVIATQNPYEFEGTYVLPESQLDRFMIRLRMGYPLRSEERRLLKTHRSGEPVESLQPVLTGEDVRRLQMAVRQVRVDDSIAEYLLDIVHASRDGDELHVGVSTSSGLDFLPGRAAQGLALSGPRSCVVPDDIKTLAVPVLPRNGSSASRSSRPASSARPRPSSATSSTGSRFPPDRQLAGQENRKSRISRSEIALLPHRPMSRCQSDEGKSRCPKVDLPPNDSAVGSSRTSGPTSGCAGPARA